MKDNIVGNVAIVFTEYLLRTSKTVALGVRAGSVAHCDSFIGKAPQLNGEKEY